MRIAGILLLPFLFLCGASAAAARDQHGSLAYNHSSGAYGFSYNYPDKYAADRRALTECGRGCRVVLRFTNGCAAFATGPGNAHAWGHAYTRSHAEQIALGKCGGRGCRIRVWACNS